MGDRVAGIIVAGGSSTRMGGDKLWAELGGRPVLAWSIQAMAGSGRIDSLVVVTSQSNQERVKGLLASLGRPALVVCGGARRRDSVWAGVEAVGEAGWCVVHDGARPFLSAGLIHDGLEAAYESGAAIAAVPVTDTIKRVEDGVIAQTLDRSVLWSAQTPQVFRTDLLRAAHERVAGDLTDDAALVEALGVTVRVYRGTYGNIKVTYPGDLELARALVGARSPLAG